MCGVNYGGVYLLSLILIFGSFLFPSSRTSVQGRNFLQLRESIFSNNLVELSVFYSIFILLFESPRQLNKGCCVLPHLGVEIKLSEILRLEPPFQELGGTVSFLPGRTLGKYCAPFCYGEFTRREMSAMKGNESFSQLKYSLSSVFSGGD